MQENSGKIMITLEKYIALKTAVKDSQKVKPHVLIYTFQKNNYLISLI